MIPKHSLKKLKKSSPYLGEIFSSHWEQTLSEYSEKLYNPRQLTLEPELLEAFREEWLAMQLPAKKVEQALQQLTELPVLQTSHHVTPTNGPVFLSLDLISLSGLPQGALYLVAANSGIAFSNSAWTGALSYGEMELATLAKIDSPIYRQTLKSAKERKLHGDDNQRITLIPAKQRDQLVFGTEIEPGHKKKIQDLAPSLSPLVEHMDEGDLYSHWATRSSALIQNRIFQTDRILYFDLNQVIKRYLLKTIRLKDHPVSKLLFEGENICSYFEFPALFLKNHRGKKSNKVDPLIRDVQGLRGRKTGLHSINPQDLWEALAKDHYCPAVFLLFFILRFLNGIKCLGSFKQVEYLEQFRRGWLKIGLDWNLNLEEDQGQSLTTGKLIKDSVVQWPLDYYLSDKTIKLQDYAQVPMGEFWTPILAQLTD
jgi:hypothetical protein